MTIRPLKGKEFSGHTTTQPLIHDLDVDHEIRMFNNGERKMKRISAVMLVVGLVAIASARADIIPSFVGSSTSASTTVWSYQIDITAGEQVTSGDFFTIYDFGHFIAGSSVQPSGWTFSSSLVGATPANVAPPDDPSLENLTWTYNGPTLPTTSGIGPFSISTVGAQSEPSLRTGYFAAQATNSGNPSTKINNVGRVSVPAPVPVPEPATLSLLAFGAAAATTRAIRRRK
jgi:FlaG/FlaF family flagellin (archaellin)